METHPLLRAVERLTPRIGVRAQWSDAGLELGSRDVISSEFLPLGHSYRRGFCALPGRDSQSVESFAQGEPFFFVTLGAPDSRLTPFQRWASWEKKTQFVGRPRWKLDRVDSVPSLHLYQSLDAEDSLVCGSLDPYTQWFLAFAAEGEAPVGKARLTDLGEGNFLLSRPYVKYAEDMPLLWEAIEARITSLGGGRLFFLFPDGTDLPARFGYRTSDSVFIHGSHN